MPEENGNAHQAAEGHPLPAITVRWDFEKQLVALDFNPADFRTWSFVKAVLLQAADKADSIHRIQAAGQLRAAQLEQESARALHQRILEGR